MIRPHRRYNEMALNARIGNKDTVLYSVWKYLLDHENSTPKEIFTAVPSCSYGHLKQGVDEGALIKTGRTYSAIPDFSFRGADNHRINRQEDIIENEVEDVEDEEVEEKKPRSSSSRGHFYLDYDTVYEKEELPDKIEMCGYTWSKIGEIYGDSLYLCDNIVNKMSFSKRGFNDWKNSDICKWLNTEFYREIPSEYKDRIVKYDGDNLFLLSEEEYEKFRNNIKYIHQCWWLRSRRNYSSYATIVDIDGFVSSIDDFNVYVVFGIRPALLLR